MGLPRHQTEGDQVAKFLLSEGIELSVTTVEPERQVVYIEADWSEDRREYGISKIGDFYFGLTEVQLI